jgi:nucleotide-binding universal stress UspA family protein
MEGQDGAIDRVGMQGISIIHPVHESGNMIRPFVHALKLALATKGELEIIDVRTEQEAMEHLGVRSYLERWGVLQPGSRRSDVAEAGIRVKKVVREGNKKQEILKRLRRHHHDILVIGTGKTDNGIFPFNRNLAEYLAEYFHQTTLFIPCDVQGFIAEASGRVDLATIILPVCGRDEFFRPSLNTIRRLMTFFPEIRPHLVAVHTGTSFPPVDRGACAELPWSEELYSETIVDSILNAAKKHKADLILMATNGRDTLAQKISGSNTEQVLRNAPCPVLSVAV